MNLTALGAPGNGVGPCASFRGWLLSLSRCPRGASGSEQHRTESPSFPRPRDSPPYSGALRVRPVSQLLRHAALQRGSRDSVGDGGVTAASTQSGSFLCHVTTAAHLLLPRPAHACLSHVSARSSVCRETGTNFLRVFIFYVKCANVKSPPELKDAVERVQPAQTPVVSRGRRWVLGCRKLCTGARFQPLGIRWESRIQRSLSSSLTFLL